jgi:hypothetical protein
MLKILIQDNEIIETAFRGELSPGEQAEYTLLKKKLIQKIMILRIQH